MFSFVVSKDVRPELAHLRAVILLHAAIVRILLRLIPDRCVTSPMRIAENLPS